MNHNCMLHMLHQTSTCIVTYAPLHHWPIQRVRPAQRAAEPSNELKSEAAIKGIRFVLPGGETAAT